PRSEDPEAILDEIWEGIPSSERSKVERVPDRRQAIIRSLDIACEGDIVLILGKGHETYQIIGNGRFDFSDQEVVRSYCAETVKVKSGAPRLCSRDPLTYASRGGTAPKQ
ncbi:MAG: hypothetical protein PHE61_00735, partial [Candidatus Omnitrophica bacterium]|nr:hypothetical protein [Candidatus Omnitrophota bacterium]